mmetsp:Transcript_11962/g.24055  ORF Transcript_11962/g.24055 Transcript_11962/m.24055 type:complete len:218 (+) Transcript_11962:681-1334(+)
MAVLPSTVVCIGQKTPSHHVCMGGFCSPLLDHYGQRVLYINHRIQNRVHSIMYSLPQYAPMLVSQPVPPLISQQQHRPVLAYCNTILPALFQSTSVHHPKSFANELLGQFAPQTMSPRHHPGHQPRVWVGLYKSQMYPQGQGWDVVLETHTPETLHYLYTQRQEQNKGHPWRQSLDRTPWPFQSWMRQPCPYQCFYHHPQQQLFYIRVVAPLLQENQ